MQAVRLMLPATLQVDQFVRLAAAQRFTQQPPVAVLRRLLDAQEARLLESAGGLHPDLAHVPLGDQRPIRRLVHQPVMIGLVSAQHLRGRREAGVVPIGDPVRLAQGFDVLPGRKLVVTPLVPQPDVDDGVNLVRLQYGNKVSVVPAGGPMVKSVGTAYSTSCFSSASSQIMPFGCSCSLALCSSVRPEL